jgi:hypothetical protein
LLVDSVKLLKHNLFPRGPPLSLILTGYAALKTNAEMNSRHIILMFAAVFLGTTAVSFGNPAYGELPASDAQHGPLIAGPAPLRTCRMAM